jgi:hypothetical protein
VFAPPGEETVLMQYSVAADWKKKILGTARRVRQPDGFPNAQLLIYLTNQEIGAAGDELRASLRDEYRLILDIRDQSWLVDRFSMDAQKLAAAEAFSEEIADPFLASEELGSARAPSLSGDEAQAAHLYLSLQWADDTRSKGLTKLSFDALVKTALRGTDSEKRKSRAEVREAVAAVIKNTDRGRVDTLTDSALGRLSGKAVRHWKQEDSFCLSHEEQKRIREGLEDFGLADRELDDALVWEIAKTAEAVGLQPPSVARELAQCVKTVIEILLYEQGEAFATAVSNNGMLPAPPDLGHLVLRGLKKHQLHPQGADGKAHHLVEATTKAVLRNPAEPVQKYFRVVADGYTLFAFLRETPDVQSAVKKMFSVGDIWLDTNVILPLFAETLLDEPAGRRYTTMFRTALELGLHLHMTPGVLEELDSHMHRSILCSRSGGSWEGRIPFLLEAWALAGNAPSSIDSWLQEFRGKARPEDDLAEYLRDSHGIVVHSLEVEADKASLELRAAVQEVWYEVHERRRGSGPGQIPQDRVNRLVSHDVENYLGVVVKRQQETDSTFGYRAWWLTLDSTAFEMRKRLGRHAPDPPVMSPDFMTNYLAFGPLRGGISKEDEEMLPLPTSAFWNTEAFSDLLEEANRVRSEMADQSDRVVRREVRDRLDAYRRREGPHARGGTSAMERDLKEKLGPPQA